MAYFLKTNKRTGWNKRTGAKCLKLLRSSIFLYTKKMFFFSFSWSFSHFDLKKTGFLLKNFELHKNFFYSCGKTLKNNKRTGWNKPVQDGKVVKN